MRARVARRQARVAVFQAMYAMGQDMIGNLSQTYDTVKPLIDVDDESEVDTTLCQELIEGVSEHREEALSHLDQTLDIPIDSINMVEQITMLLAVVEMLSSPNTPRAVVMNEWIEITKEFGAPQGYKIVNAILDKLKLPATPRDGD